MELKPSCIASLASTVKCVRNRGFFEFRRDLWHQKTIESPGYHVWRYLRDLKFSRFYRIPDGV